ncbi:hypothetical protein [Haloarcula laminariae]|uniref:hypothetical protein n=1 Tax=Haloarcula laminariae TaxID=2961577 RepID=UPI0024062986|nr:hypothetical protein [Halomicroarcula sp. FL173]
MVIDVTDMDDARELAPDDIVGNALCDALLEAPSPSVIRVLRAYGDWSEAVPAVQDYIITLKRAPSVVARWPAPDDQGTAVLVYYADGIRRRRASDSPTATAEIVTLSEVRRTVEARGRPELVPREETVLEGDR